VETVGPLTLAEGVIVAIAALAGLVLAVIKYIGGTPVRLFSRFKLVRQLEGRAPVFGFLRELFGGPPEGHPVRSLGTRAELAAVNSRAADLRMTVERIAVLAGSFLILPIAWAAGVPWYVVELVSVAILGALWLPEYLLYRVFLKRVESWDPFLPTDYQKIRRFLNHHYLVSGAELTILYVYAIAIALSLPTLPSLGSPLPIQFLPLIIAPVVGYLAWRVVAEYVDSRELMYDALYHRVLLAGQIRETEVVLRFGPGTQQPLEGTLSAVGRELGITDDRGYAYRLDWTKIETIGVRETSQQTLPLSRAPEDPFPKGAPANP
jgi:hypothetical protein